jgi:DNA-binding PadR family transcriptional regulator
MIAITDEEFELLKELNERGGIARISDGKPRHAADRLVEAGYATSRALNMSDIEYEVTEAGRKALDVRTRP